MDPEPPVPAPSDEAVSAAHANLMRPRCRKVIVDRRNVPSALTAAYAIDIPRVRAEERERMQERIDTHIEEFEKRLDEVRAEERAATLRQSERLRGVLLEIASGHPDPRGHARRALTVAHFNQEAP